MALAVDCYYLLLSDLHMVVSNLGLLSMPFIAPASLFHTTEAALRPLTILVLLLLSFLMVRRPTLRASLEWCFRWSAKVLGLTIPVRFRSLTAIALGCAFWLNIYIAGILICLCGGMAVSNLSIRAGYLTLGESVFNFVRSPQATEFGASGCLNLAYESDISGKIGDQVEETVSKVYGADSLELARIFELRGDDLFARHRDFVKAEMQYGKALTLYQRNEKLSGVCDVLGATAAVQRRQNKLVEARANFSAALNMIKCGSVIDSYALTLEREDAEKLGLSEQFEKSMAVGCERRKLWCSNLSPLVRYGNIINNVLIAVVFFGTFLLRAFVFWSLERKTKKTFDAMQASNEFSVYVDSLADITELELLRSNSRTADLSSRLLLNAVETQSISKDGRLSFVPASWREIFTLRQFLNPAYVILLGFLFLQFRYY